jgi:plasmid stability protein
MPDILVRDLDKHTIKRLKARAAENGRSLQTEVKDILERSARQMTNRELYKRAVRYSKRFEGRHLTDSVDLVREDRER